MRAADLNFLAISPNFTTNIDQTRTIAVPDSIKTISIAVNLLADIPLKYSIKVYINNLFALLLLQGALSGSICSLLIVGWIVFGAQTAIVDGSYKQPYLPTSVEGCKSNITLSQPLE